MGCRVLVVDDQELAVRLTTKLLAQEAPDFLIEGFTDPVKALEALTKEPPDILVTDLRMVPMDGLELIIAAREVVPGLPVVLMTAYDGPEVIDRLRGRSLVEYLAKPLDSKSLFASVDRLVGRRRGFSGTISLPMLPDLVQVYTLSCSTGILRIRSGEKEGAIWFENGQLIHAVCGKCSGEAAVHRLITWPDGQFSLDPITEEVERTITVGWQEVLLEGCRRLDEADRDSGPSGVSAPLDGGACAQVDVCEDAEERKVRIGECLARLATVDGFLAAAVFDAGSVSSLKSGNDDVGVDLETVVVSNAAALASIQRNVVVFDTEESVADIVISLQRQYQLIRPVHQQESVLLYLALDKVRGNLALARLQLAKAEWLFCRWEPANMNSETRNDLTASTSQFLDSASTP